jgi:hypothetical protein
LYKNCFSDLLCAALSDYRLVLTGAKINQEQSNNGVTCKHLYNLLEAPYNNGNTSIGNLIV